MAKKYVIKVKVIIVNLIKDIKCFSLSVAFFHMLYFMFANLEDMNKENNSRTYKISNRMRLQSIQKYLKNKYSNLINKYRQYEIKNSHQEQEENLPIWIFWWQGYELAPDIIKICTASKKKYANNHSVNIVTKDNIAEYVYIPEYIMKKVDNKKISITHLSDILRASLLAQYGGIWLDASILCFDLPESIFKQDFFTCKSWENIDNISKGRWTGYAIGGKKGNRLFCFMRDFFFEYWKSMDQLIDYFLIDHVINIAYEELEDVKIMIDNVFDNNSNREKLSLILNQRFEEKIFESVREDNTFLFKLAWKQNFEKYTQDGDRTFYSYLTEGLQNNEE